MKITLEQVIQKRNGGDLKMCGFGREDFYYCSFIGEVEELQGYYLPTDEYDYPVFGMSIMVICTKQYERLAASLIEKICKGNPWLLVQWVVDRGIMIEHVGVGGCRWNDYGVRFDMKFATLGDCFYQKLAKDYYEALNNG